MLLFTYLSLFLSINSNQLEPKWVSPNKKKKARKIFKQHIDFNRHKLLFLLTFILPQRINMQALSSWIRKVRRVK